MADNLHLCEHPTNAIRYYSGIDEEGYFWEEHLCLLCDCLLLDCEVNEIQRRPGWTQFLSLDEHPTL